MEQLTLPAYSYKLKNSAGKIYIYDAIRKKWLVLTPEEWVRQHLINYLHVFLGFPTTLMRIERGTAYNKLQKRTDICVFDTQGNPLLLVECKAPQIPIATATVQQAAIYNQTIKAPFLLVSNGRQHYCWSVGPDGISLEPMPELLTFEKLIQRLQKV